MAFSSNGDGEGREGARGSCATHSSETAPRWRNGVRCRRTVPVDAARIGDNRRGTPCADAMNPPFFAPFAILYMGEPIKLDYLWAGLCLMGAFHFIFRG
jgi:hypothetical protein